MNNSVAASRVAGWKTAIIDVAALGAFVVLLFWQVLKPGTMWPNQGLWTDFLSLVHTTYSYTGRHLAQGDLPLWNPYWFAGYPHLAMPHSATLYPTTILFGWFSFPTALKIVTVVHLWLMGTFTYLCGRDMFQHRAIALSIGMTTVALLSTATISSGHLWSLQSLTWVPLAFLGLRRIWVNGSLAGVVVMAISLTLCLFGGDPMSWLFSLYFFGVYSVGMLVAHLVRRTIPVRGTAIRSVLALSAVGLAVLLSGVQLLPTLEYFGESVREGGLSREGMLSRQRGLPPYAHLEAIFNTYRSRFVPVSSLGAVAALGLLAAWRRAELWALALALLVCGFYATMPPWFYEIIQHVPGYNGIRGVMRSSVMMHFALLLIAGYGAHALLQSHGNDKSERRLWTLFLALLGLFVLLPLRNGNAPPPETLAGLAAAFAILAFGWVWNYRRLAASAIAAILVVELFVWSKNHIASGDPQRLELADKFSTVADEVVSLDRLVLASHHRDLPHGPSVTMLTEHRGLTGYHGLYLERYADLLQQIGGVEMTLEDESGKFVRTKRIHDQALILANKGFRALDLLNVRHILILDPKLKELYSPHPRYRVSREQDFMVVTNLRAMPPAFPIHDLKVCTTREEALAELANPDFDYRRTAVVEQPLDVPLGKPRRPEPMAFTVFEPERIVATVDFDAPGLLVFSEMYYPGWKASVDGSPFEDVLAVNTALRGVWVDAGEHTVTLQYSPNSFRRGMLLSAVGLVICLGIVSLVLFRSDSAGESESE